MARNEWYEDSFRGVLHSEDGVITKVFESNKELISFQAAFRLCEELLEKLKRPADSLQQLINKNEPLIFSERSRIARLGVQINCEPLDIDNLQGDTLTLSLSASAVIPGFPALKKFKQFMVPGFPVGRLVYCDPAALLSSEEVIAAIDKGDLKLPASTKISSDGTIYISPHNAIFVLKETLDQEVLERIMLRDEGRELLNLYQIRQDVPLVVVPAGQGVVTTCSMYLSNHYVVLQSGMEWGRQLPATFLDPIKTRGVRIFLEIINRSDHPIVNPLIPAKIFSTTKTETAGRRGRPAGHLVPYGFKDLQQFEKQLDTVTSATCHFINKPVAVVAEQTGDLGQARIFTNGPDAPCPTAKPECAAIKRYGSPKSICPHLFATSRLENSLPEGANILIMKYFPNVVEHHDIINLIGKGLVHSIFFFEPSLKYGPFLSDRDHLQLEDYHHLGVKVYWVSNLLGEIMVSTMRDGKGYFVKPERLAAFQKSMLFAFYGSNIGLSGPAVKNLSRLMDALLEFWGQNIGIVTGGGSGVMEHANLLARERGILSGANFLEITDQTMTTDVDFCQVFQATCRHSRQKWFEIASFPIFNVGGLGSLEELGITLCNMKLSITDPVPIILFDTDGQKNFWEGAGALIQRMVDRGRAPAWIVNNLIITDEPREVIAAYREKLQLL